MKTAAFTDSQVEQTWRALRARVNAFCRAVEDLSDEQRALAPPKGFNSVETLVHLALTDKFELGLICKTEGPVNKPPKINFLGRFAIKSMKKPKPMPTMSEMTPPAETKASLEAAREAGAEWNRVLDEITELAAQCRSDQTLLKHPLFGRFSPLDLAELMTVHMNYHERRIQEVIPDFRA